MLENIGSIGAIDCLSPSKTWRGILIELSETFDISKFGLSPSKTWRGILIY